MLVPAAEYRPDVSPLNSSFTDELVNVLCADGGYIPAPAFETLAAAFPGVPRGWLTVRSLDGTVRFFAATDTDLYLLDNTDLSWDNVSKVSGGYNANQESPWSMRSFGSYVIAVNANDDPQVYQIGTDVLFRNLGGSPPRASFVRTWGDFVVLLGLPTHPNRAHWSGLNDCEFWTPGTNSCDYQDFPDGGRLQGASEATNPLILMEEAIYLGTFVPGSVEIYTFQKLHDKRGASSPYSIASRGSLTFFADTGGFFQISADGALTPIGYEKVDRTVFRELSSSAISRIQGAIDPFYSRVYWALDYAGLGVYSEIIVYDWQIGKWTVLATEIQGLFPLAAAGITLDGLDAVSASLDALPFSLDSKAWQGGAPLLGAFDAEGNFGAFTGDNLEATVVTQEFGDTAGGVSRTTRCYPVVDAAEVYMSIGQRFRRTDAVTWLPEAAPSSNTGQVRKRSRARFHRFKIRIPAGVDWTHLQGVDADVASAGFR